MPHADFACCSGEQAERPHQKPGKQNHGDAADEHQHQAEFLAAHPAVDKVYWPGLKNHNGHEVAKRQMKKFGGMVSFTVKGAGFEKTADVVSSFEVFTLAESLGGVESLAGHPASMTHASIPKEEREKVGVTDNLIRLSVGIEHIDDLIADLAEALDK